MTRSKVPRRLIQVAYPPGSKELTPDLSKDEMVRRLKMLARVFQDMEQEEDTTAYEPLALHLLEPFLFKHSSKDVRLLVACCLADVFRIFAPEAPYRTAEQLKIIFQFLNKQLWGLENVEGPSWKRYFYLLENLAMVKSFNICMELEDSAEIFVELFTIFFSIINENHTPKVRTFMLDVMCPLICENDVVPQELLEVILGNLLDSKQVQHPQAHDLARDLVKRTSTSIEPSIQAFFNSVLILGKSSTSDLASHCYELIYQLHTISSNLLLAVLPQLEFKLKSNDERERLSVTKLLGRMFSDRDSVLASQNKPLWTCFLGRFSDISVPIRLECVKFVPQFIQHHPYLITDLADRMRERAHDTDEGVRQEVVASIVTAAKRDIMHMKEELLILVKERTLDKKWRIRKEAVLGLGHIFKKWYYSQDMPSAEKRQFLWIRDKVLHMYYQPNIEDRLLVERIFTMTLVPYTMDVKDRMRRLYLLFASVDENSCKAIIEMMKCQHYVRQHMRDLMVIFDMDDEELRKQAFVPKVAAIAKMLPEPGKAQEHLRRMIDEFSMDKRARVYMQQVISPKATCKKAIQGVGEVMKKFGNPKNPSPLYETMKTLMERVAPLLIDVDAITEVVKLVAAEANGTADEVDGLTARILEERGLKLLQILALVYPRGYSSQESYEKLIQLLQIGEDNIADVALQVLTQTGHGMQADFPQIAEGLIKTLVHLAKNGSPTQAKRAIKCLDVAANNKKTIFQELFQSVCKNISLVHESHLTALMTVGQLARLAPDLFREPMKALVANTVVKGMLMQDQTEATPTKGIWCHDNMVTEETQAKIRCIKLLVHWLEGVNSNHNGSATSTIRLLTTMIKNEGDLMEKQKISKASMSRLRLAAGCALLKLARITTYVELLTLEQFQTLALLINDECYQVREQFAVKLNRGLSSLRLPLMFLSIFSLCAKDPVQESKSRAMQYVIRNIATRREYLKNRTLTANQMLSVLPEYVIPFTIHLLTHDPDFMTLKDSEALTDIKECIWFMLEPLIDKAENCSFMRKLLETIKQMKDAQCVEDRSRNRKMYALCDMTLGLLQSKAPFLIIKDHPGDILLPKKLFRKPRKNLNNSDNYLPKRFQEQFKSPEKDEEEKAESPAPKGRGKRALVKKETPQKAGGGDASAVILDNGDENSSPVGKGKRKRVAAKAEAATPKGDATPSKRPKRGGKTREAKKDQPLTEKINEGNRPSSGRPTKAQQAKAAKAKGQGSKVTRGRASQSSSSSQSSASDIPTSPESSPVKGPQRGRVATKRGAAAPQATKRGAANSRSSRSSSSQGSSTGGSQSPAPKRTKRLSIPSPKKAAAMADDADVGRGRTTTKGAKPSPTKAPAAQTKQTSKRSASSSDAEMKKMRGRPARPTPSPSPTKTPKPAAKPAAKPVAKPVAKPKPAPPASKGKAKTTAASKSEQPPKLKPVAKSPAKSPQKTTNRGASSTKAQQAKSRGRPPVLQPSPSPSPVKSAKKAAPASTKATPRLSSPPARRGRPAVVSPARSGTSTSSFYSSSSSSKSKSPSPVKKVTVKKGPNVKKVFAVKGSPIKKFATKTNSAATAKSKASPTKTSAKRNMSSSSSSSSVSSSPSPRKLVNGTMSPKKSPGKRLVQTTLKTNMKKNVRQTSPKKVVPTKAAQKSQTKLNISRKSVRRR